MEYANNPSQRGVRIRANCYILKVTLRQSSTYTMFRKKKEILGDNVRWVGRNLRPRVNAVGLVNSENFKQAVARAKAKDQRNSGKNDEVNDQT